MLSKVYTVKELQQILKIGRKQAYELISSGEIPSMRIGSSIRIPVQGVDSFINLLTNGEIQTEEKQNDKQETQLGLLTYHI